MTVDTSARAEGRVRPPEGTMVVSYSEMDSFLQCPLKWKLHYVDRMRPPTTSKSLIFGSAWHTMMETHYGACVGVKPKDRQTPIENARTALVGSAWEPDLSDDELARLQWMLEGYSETFGTDPMWRPLEVEGMRWVELIDGIYLIVKYDMLAVYEKNGKQYLIDHKTQKGKDASGPAPIKDYELEPQLPLYQAAMRELGEDVHSTAYWVTRTDQLKRSMTTDERFGRHQLPVNDEFLTSTWQWAQKTALRLREVREELVEGDQGSILSYPVSDRCSWRCAYKEPHLLSMRTGMDIVEATQEFRFEYKDPSTDTHR